MSNQYFEQILIRTKYLVYVPVVVLLIASVAISAWTVLHFGLSFDFASISEKGLVIHVVSMIDAFLLSILTLMIAVSLYELYILPISEHAQVPQAFLIGSLDELKNKIGKLVYMILLVAFFKEVLKYSFTTIGEIVLLALAIALVALSLCLLQGTTTQSYCNKHL